MRVTNDTDLKAVQNLNTNRAWRIIVERLEGEIAKLRAINESDLDPIETAKVRGQILSIRRVLKLPAELVNEFNKKLEP